MDGDVFTCGSVRDTYSVFAITKFKGDSMTLDTTFGGQGSDPAGMVTKDLTGITSHCFGIEINSNGEIVAVGNSYFSGDQRNFVLRMDRETGETLGGFGNGVVGEGVYVDSFPENAYGALMVLDSQDNVVMSFRQVSDDRVRFAKINGRDGTLDATIGTDGYYDAGISAVTYKAVKDGKGRMVITAAQNDSGNWNSVLLRLWVE